MEFLNKDFWEANEEQFFTRDEVAKIRRCSKAKLAWEAANNVGITHIIDGNKSLYKKQDIVAFMEGKKK